MQELTLEEIEMTSGGISPGTIRALEFGVTFAGGLAAAMTIGVPLAIGAAAVAGAYAVGYLIGEGINELSH